MVEKVHVLNMNVRGLSNLQKRDSLKTKNMSIYCFIDINANDQKSKFILFDWGHECLFISLSSSCRGVAIVIIANQKYILLVVIDEICFVKLCDSENLTF